MLAGKILDLARTHLNDDGGTNWPDPNLLPKLQEAHNEMTMELLANGIPVIHEVSTVLLVPAGTLDLTTVTNYPTDLVTPIRLKERFVGQQTNDFINMVAVDFIPQVQQDIRLIWYSWMKEKIFLLGALADVEVLLTYERSLPVPQTVADLVDFLYAELFLSHRTASLAYNAAGQFDKGERYAASAIANLSKVIRMNVNRTMQPLPAKARGYHRTRRNDTIIRGL